MWYASVRKSVALCTLTALMVIPNLALAQAEPGWTEKVIKRGEDKKQSDATPIHQRPYRPFHFYGNTVRRLHYRGSARVTVKDVRQTVRQVSPR